MSSVENAAKQPVRIAVDAMGGDLAPLEIVKGAILGARQHGVAIRLVGEPTAIRQSLAGLETDGLDIEIIPATEVVDMAEAASVLRKKKNASIVVTARSVAQGDAQAMVAAGSTGAAMAAAVLHIGRLPGIDRPAIGVVLPSTGKPCILLDAGANADCTPEMLVQFGRMGSVFMENVYNIPRPRVGLMNIGEEAGKGNAFVNAAFPLLQADERIHFIGNIEGRDMFLGNAEVAVCDGFTGNVALKSVEGVVTMLMGYLKHELTKSLPAKIAGALAMPAFRRAKKRVDHEEFGGALLLGIRGVCVIAHGGSRANAINNAIRVAKEAVEADVLGKINGLMAEGSPVSCP